jgi:sugar fermentation stimulation protein A
MRFDQPLVPATLERRYKRFLADVSLGAGHMATAHCPNPGSLLGLASTGAAVLLSDRGKCATRRLRFTWEAVRTGRAWVCVNTARANQMALEALRACRIRPLARYSMITPEVRVSPASRIDFLLRGAAPEAFVEVKSVTLRSGSGALFPDAVTERGRRHLEELARLARRGRRAVLLFLVMRGDCRWVGPADAIDPAYARTLRRVARRGVEVLGYAVRVSARGLTLGRRLPLRLRETRSDPRARGAGPRRALLQSRRSPLRDWRGRGTLRRPRRPGPSTTRPRRPAARRARATSRRRRIPAPSARRGLP